jgi:DNA-binding transcriptional regulator GbsR (MarR family)
VKISNELHDFVERLGLEFESQSGMPRMAGRVVGWLLVCDPPEASAAELAAALGASAGSISTTTRLLIRLGLVERVRLPGERIDRFRIRPDRWAESLRQEERLRAFLVVLRQGLDALAGAPAERRARLEEMEAMYAYWERRIPELWEEYEEHRRRTKGSR